MSDQAAHPPREALSKPEFIALIAMNFAMVAFSIDAMLPALPEIAREISPDAVNQAQLVLTSFVFGMGVGTLFSGPLSDAFGRKPIIAAGIAIYCVGAALAAQAETMEQMVLARALQGLGVAGPRIVALAIIRDLYAGRGMAQIMSFAMMVFTLVPAAAPLLGAVIIDAFGWRMIFYVFVGFALLVGTWLMVRQPETLPRAVRTPFRPTELWLAMQRCLASRRFRICTLIQALIFGMLFGTLSSTQQVFADSFGRGDSFPAWFAVIALVGGTASLINARLVMALGMRRMIFFGFAGQVLISAIVVIWLLLMPIPFTLYMIWTTSLFFMVGVIIGNLNAIAMEPLGDIAGMAASIIGSVSTVLAVFIAVPIGLAFDGTPLPLAIGTLVLSVLSLATLHLALPDQSQTTS